MPCGTILRQALQYDTIAAVILYDESRPGERAVVLQDVDVTKKQTGQGLFWNFFGWINKGSFEVSADAFTTFRVCHPFLFGPTVHSLLCLSGSWKSCKGN